MFATTFATAPHAALQINGLSNNLVSRVATTTLKVGDVVTIQSGNEGDSYWTPKAQMVVLELEEGKFGMMIATGVCKRDDGTLSLKIECAQYGVGELFYATRALFDYQMMRYLSASDYNKYTRLMSTYADEIEHLEAYTEVHKDYSK